MTFLMKTISLVTVAIFAVRGLDSSAAEITPPLAHAHAHNDFEHARPLQDALDRGFCSVEADIWLVDGKLLVGHDPRDLNPERTLESLYLDPLRDRIGARNGKVYGSDERFWLLVDIKSGAEPTYKALHEVLARYAEMLTTVHDDKIVQKAISVVVSGVERPQEYMARQKLRYAGVDGRLNDLESDAPAHLMPMLSDRWTAHFAWSGNGPMPDAEHKRLREIIDKAHNHGRVVRFWATPELPAVWRELRSANVDLIGTDRLDELREFFESSVK
jgi:hypothetical protein